MINRQQSLKTIKKLIKKLIKHKLKIRFSCYIVYLYYRKCLLPYSQNYVVVCACQCDNGVLNLCNERVISLHNTSSMLLSRHPQLPSANLKQKDTDIHSKLIQVLI